MLYKINTVCKCEIIETIPTYPEKRRRRHRGENPWVQRENPDDAVDDSRRPEAERIINW